MRLIAEIVVVIALLALGWHEPFRARIGQVIPALAESSPKPVVAASGRRTAPEQAANTHSLPAGGVRTVPVAAPTPTPDNSWIWDPNRPGTLDAKKKK